MSALSKNKTLPIALTAALITITILIIVPAHADQLGITEGTRLYYKWARIGSGAGGTQTGNATFEILAANQTTIIVYATGTTSVTLTIKYQDGIPTYAERIEALIYLPQKCITQTLQGNLEWTTKLKTKTATVINGKAQQQEFTVEAGTFQSLNITLNLVEWMYGNLTLIYDVNSGILLYEQWIPEYGDMIVQSLSAVTQAIKPQNVALSILITATTFATPTAITISETNKALKKRGLKNKKSSQETAEKGVFPKKTFYLILTGATLNLASTLLPWSQLAKRQMFLPLSLPTALTAPTTLIPFAISLMAHSAAILAWIGIAMHLYANRKLTHQLAILISSILSFASVAIFVQSGLTPLWGVLTMTIGGTLTILGVIATNAKIKIITEEAEKPKESEKTQP